ncbi:alpha/beta fold hydrolase [Sphingomonas sp. 28-63-12]|uniref:alpha/beta fold hydrolase n=1 Tax=Sphingomonas sp. 28-63-12 TaxID=1970434 RepID=UPI000BD5DB7B|nr:MAG: hypothetical protein B7Y47_00030 [Sphingomonas sp. 28-63-12]
MPQMAVKDLTLEYDVFGDPAGRPLLLIAGHSCQMVFWDERVCEQLAEAGHFVIRFDNRDCGRSSRLDKAGVPNRARLLLDFMLGRPIDAPYLFGDMADDAAGLLDGLGIGAAHVCGMSMGCSIAQHLAIRHPARVASMTLIYGTTGRAGLSRPSLSLMRYFVTEPPKARQAFRAHFVSSFGRIAGSGFHFDHEWHDRLADRVFERGISFPGTLRQAAAAAASGSTAERLASLEMPALIVHGTKDPLQPIDGGIDLAASLPNARMMVIDGWGHDMPHGGEPWPRIVDAIAAHTLTAVAR